MPIVAIAGGTSPTLGRSIVHAIQSTSNINTPIILTRRSGSAPKTKWNAAVRQVDYDNHISLVAALRGVHTVISVIKVVGEQWLTCQLALLQAAQEAGVKRFAPSEFGLGPLADDWIDALTVKAKVWEACLNSELEVGRFVCGGYMNRLSLGYGFNGDREKELWALAGLEDMPFIWDVVAGTAEEPTKDDGTSPLITLTDIWDVGKFVAATCELEEGKWVAEMEMVGETIKITDVTNLVEKYLGRKLHITRIQLDELARRAEAIEGVGRNPEELMQKMLAQMAMVYIDEEVGGAIMEPIVNRMCPWVKATGVETYLRHRWSNPHKNG
jgi:hypothetical protein